MQTHPICMCVDYISDLLYTYLDHIGGFYFQKATYLYPRRKILLFFEITSYDGRLG